MADSIALHFDLGEIPEIIAREVDRVLLENRDDNNVVEIVCASIRKKISDEMVGLFGVDAGNIQISGLEDDVMEYLDNKK